MTGADLFHSAAFVLARNVVILVAVVFWFSLALWVFRDARRRIEEPAFVALATLIGLVPPFIGPLVYLLVRPAETLEDRRSRAIELRALEGVLGHRRETCPSCAATVESDFVVCPVCTYELRRPCAHCNAALEPDWQMCPYCTTAVGHVHDDVDAALTAEVREIAQLNGHGSFEPQTAEG
ncbi:MAG TPA: zinc ribbon domain-containing protein [Gaiellaceae bacterium]|nr:zinc ribbon domain-containing protein [Gaiellaceae bacterium]